MPPLLTRKSDAWVPCDIGLEPLVIEDHRENRNRLSDRLSPQVGDIGNETSDVGDGEILDHTIAEPRQDPRERDTVRMPRSGSNINAGRLPPARRSAKRHDAQGLCEQARIGDAHRCQFRADPSFGSSRVRSRGLPSRAVLGRNPTGWSKRASTNADIMEMLVTRLKDVGAAQPFDPSSSARTVRTTRQ